MQDYFQRQKAQREENRPAVSMDAERPVPLPLAHVLSMPNPLRTNRRLRRAGLGYIFAPNAHPPRHTVCRHCDRRTYTSAGGTCRRCFINGEGDEVTYR